MPLDEAFDPVPEDPYSLSKLVNEKTCAAYHRAYGMTTAAFRFAGVWSEERYRQKLAEGLPPTEAWSDLLYQWVHVTDVVRGLRQALEAPDLPGFGTYTLAAGDTQCPEPTMELLARFRPDLAATVDPLPAGPRPAAVHRPGAAHLRLRADPPPRTVAVRSAALHHEPAVKSPTAVACGTCSVPSTRSSARSSASRLMSCSVSPPVSRL